MKQQLQFVLQYLLYYKWKSLLIIMSLTVLMFLPLALNLLITQSEVLLRKRASETPLIIGKKGGATELVLNTLYFRNDKTHFITMSDLKGPDESGLGSSIPLHTYYQARDYAIVGTRMDYFSFRSLNLREGNYFAFLGECVVGWEVAKKLRLAIGDSISSSPENYLDFAGFYPLSMIVTGILEETKTPDDRAIFTDLKTTWVIAGIGHGHEDKTKLNDPALYLENDSNSVVFGSKLMLEQGVTAENMNQFHFHGNPGQYPITSAIFIPKDQKSEALIRGKFESGEFSNQVIVPLHTVDGILQGVFRLSRVFNVFWIAVFFAVLLIMGLVAWLSLQMRREEFSMLSMLGAGSNRVVKLVFLEYVLLVMVSTVLTGILVWLTGNFTQEFMNKVI